MTNFYVTTEDAVVGARAELFQRAKRWGHLPAGMTFRAFVASADRGLDPFIRPTVPLSAKETFRPERLEFEPDYEDATWLDAAWTAMACVLLSGAVLALERLL